MAKPVLQVRAAPGPWENLADGQDPKELATVAGLSSAGRVSVLHAINLYLLARIGQGGADGPGRADKIAAGWGVTIRAK